MLKPSILTERWATIKGTIEGLVLIANAFVWYFYAFTVLQGLIGKSGLTSTEATAVWVVNFAGTAISALIGATATSRTGKRTDFLLAWILTGTICSIIPIFFSGSVESLFLVSLLFGASFGIGMPTAMAYFADSTSVENRGSSGGIIFLIIGFGVFLLGQIKVADISSMLIILAAWRGIGLIAFSLIKSRKDGFGKTMDLPYVALFSQRPFILYLVPWIMFCLVNQTIAPIITRFFGTEFVNLSTIIELGLSGLCALISGFFCDRVGRKRIAIFGFVVLGVGYAALGILPESIASWYVYSVADGVAWGIFYSIFFFTVWGDLASGTHCEKYYAVGGLPYLFSTFVRLALGSYIASAVKELPTVFSLASLFLFLAVLPLVYAPETLSEKKMKDRELKAYVEKAMEARTKCA